MIRSYTDAKDKEIYGDYKWVVHLFFILSIPASVFTGMAEWNGFKSDELAISFPILYPVAGLALIQSLRVVVPALFLTISRMIKKFDWKRIPVLLIFMSLTVALIYLSIDKAESGIVHKAERQYAFDDSLIVDSTKYNMLCETCQNNWESDSIAAAVKAKSEYGDDLKSAADAKIKANQRISQVKDSKETWAVKTVSQKTKEVRVALGTIKSINKQIDAAIKDSLSIYRSEYKACMARANDTLHYYTNMAEHGHIAAKNKNEAKKERSISSNYIFMWVGVIFIILHAALEQWLYHVSGVEVIYNFNATDRGIGFKEKASAILKVHIQNLGNAFLNVLSLGHELSVNNDELIIKERSKSANSGSKWWQVLKRNRDKKRLEIEAEQAQKNEELEMRKAEIEAERLQRKYEREMKMAQIEAERLSKMAEIEAAKSQIELANIAAKNQVKKAEIEAQNKIELQKIAAENERKRLAAESEAAIARTKAEAELQQQKEQQERRQQELENTRKQESEKLRQQQQEIENEKQRLALEQQEVEKQKALLAQAEQLATETQQKAAETQQVKAALETAMQTIKSKTATGKNLQDVEVQQVVNDMFEKHIENGLLKINKNFNTAVKNYYKRWKEAEERLKEDLSDARRQQIKIGCEDNRNKFLYAVDKAANLNVEIKVVGDSLQINYMDKD